MKQPNRVAMEFLRIGDVVMLHDDFITPGDQMTVANVENDEISFFRPYTSLSGFIAAGGAIPYVGFEEVKMTIQNGREYNVVGNIYHGS